MRRVSQAIRWICSLDKPFGRASLRRHAQRQRAQGRMRAFAQRVDHIGSGRLGRRDQRFLEPVRAAGNAAFGDQHRRIIICATEIAAFRRFAILGSGQNGVARGTPTFLVATRYKIHRADVPLIRRAPSIIPLKMILIIVRKNDHDEKIGICQ